MSRSDQDNQRDLSDLERLAKQHGLRAGMAQEELRLIEMVINLSQDLARLQGLTQPRSLTRAQYQYWKHDGPGSDSGWRGDPPPVDLHAEDQMISGRRAELRPRSGREKRWDEADLQRQEDENPQTPLSMADKENLPF